MDEQGADDGTAYISKVHSTTKALEATFPLRWRDAANNSVPA